MMRSKTISKKTVDHSRPCDTVLMKTVNLRQEEPAEKILEKSDYSPPPDKIYEKDFTRNGQDQTPVMLNMTAAELRAKLKERKKFDPKKDGMDFKKKYDIVQKL
uniref:Uncharacterized protein n=1 Tax=Photinus pyralis TaxID=7054 RepID=A0A1Y1ME98_PHOPY